MADQSKTEVSSTLTQASDKPAGLPLQPSLEKPGNTAEQRFMHEQERASQEQAQARHSALEDNHKTRGNAHHNTTGFANMQPRQQN